MKEIEALEQESMALRDQLDYLEQKEAKVADKISAKRKQLDTQLNFNFSGEE